MGKMKIQGYIRENGEVGIRNHVLVLSATRASHILAAKIAENVSGAKHFVACDEDGKSASDRATMSRVFIGLGCNPNVHSVVVVCNKKNEGYPEMQPGFIADSIRKSGKEVFLLSVEESGGFYNALGEGIRISRRFSENASAVRTGEVDFGKLKIGIKCGLSDATSGLTGNPVVGYMADRLIEAGGTVIFSETTEVIGAERILAERCVSDSVKADFLNAVFLTEEEARKTGEDIRTINPIPANIEAGISTLEEKSLGAMAKTGNSMIQGVLSYGQIPDGAGLYFMDSWMSSSSLFLGYASCGAALTLFLMGGMALPENPPMPAISTGLVAPILYASGNPRTAAKAADEIDFNAGLVLEKKETIAEAGERLIKHICDIASGRKTKSETWRYQDPVEIFLRGPNL